MKERPVNRNTDREETKRLCTITMILEDKKAIFRVESVPKI